MNIPKDSVDKILFFLTLLFTLFLPKINLANSIACGILFLWMYKCYKREIYFQKDLLFFSVLLFISSFFVSYLFSWNWNHIHFLTSETRIFKSLLLLIAPFILFLIVSTIDFKTNQVRLVIKSFTLVMLAGILYSALMYFHSPFAFTNRLSIFALHPNRTGELISMVCIVLITSLGFEKKVSKIIVKTVLLSVSLLGLLLTFSRGAWIGMFFSVLWLTLFGFHNKRIKIAAVILIICITLAFICIPTFQNRFQSIFSKNDNNGRIVLWDSSLKMIHNLPWFNLGPNKWIGIGPKMFPVYFDQLVPNNHESDPMAHNNFLQMAVELGFIGFISYSLMVTLIFMKAFSLKKEATESNLELVLIFIGWFISWNVHGLVDCPFKYSTVTYMLMLLLGMLISVNKKSLMKGLSTPL